MPFQGGGEIPEPIVHGYSVITTVDRTISRPRKRRFNERVEKLSVPPLLFATTSHMFT